MMIFRGESYLDVIARLEPIIIEMERHTEPLLIIGHQVRQSDHRYVRTTIIIHSNLIPHSSVVWQRALGREYCE